jgi:hypothetical protein
VTTLDEIYRYVPGGQQLEQQLPNTARSLVPGHMAAAWLIFGAALDYNSALGVVPPRDFSPLDNLVADARMISPSVTELDSEDDLAEQRENATGFRNAQLNVIFREND